ncbi:anaerobic ribonucleoside-triphosphate reductase activating protein [Candidatus Woesearchaeota archaeon]|nr:anaerobic ribonucleoside-triphosphate reductase activating protein [Candidatus Woesearchaeota archaeon]
MAIIKGIQKTSMVDYPGRIAAVLFTSGCNMRCPFCQNPDLVLDNRDIPELNTEKILDFLRQRRKWLDGVCITGGEPLLYPDIIELIRKIKGINLMVKLDTNGLNPGLLKKITSMGLADYVAMDIKSDRQHYKEASGTDLDISKIEESIEIIKNSAIDYEFRSTIVPDFFDEEIVENIGKWINGAKRYCLQQFRSNLPLLDKSFEGKEPYKKEILEKFRRILGKYADEVMIRA